MAPIYSAPISFTLCINWSGVLCFYWTTKQKAKNRVALEVGKVDGKKGKGFFFFFFLNI